MDLWPFESDARGIAAAGNCCRVCLVFGLVLSVVDLTGGIRRWTFFVWWCEHRRACSAPPCLSVCSIAGVPSGTKVRDQLVSIHNPHPPVFWAVRGLFFVRAVLVAVRGFLCYN